MKEPTPLKAIRKFCIEKCAEDKGGVKDCAMNDCPLWQYRLGHNPRRKGVSPRKRTADGKFLRSEKQRKRITITGDFEVVNEEK